MPKFGGADFFVTPVRKPVCKPLPGGGLKPASKWFRRAAMRVNAKWRLTELRVCAITV